MAWDIGADEYTGSATQTRVAAIDAVLGPITKTITASADARIITSGAGGGPWDIGADELTGTEGLAVSFDAHVVDLTNSQTITASADGAIAPPGATGLTINSYGVSWISLSWTDNSGGLAQHRVYQQKLGAGLFTEAGLTWLGETSFTFRYLDSGATYLVGVAAVDGATNVEGPLVYTSQATAGGAEKTVSCNALIEATVPLTVDVSVHVQSSSTGPIAKRVSGRFV